MGRFVPKLITVLREGYTKDLLFADLTSGLIVGIVALPLAIAFAIASGVNPAQGLFTAIVAGIIVSALGGSRVQIAGPTGAFIVIVYRIVQTHGYDGLAIATLMAGVMLVVMGLSGFGSLLKFVPYPLTVGFTTGIALIIFSSQPNDFLGLGVRDLPPDFIDKWAAYADHLTSIDPLTVAVGAASLVLILVSQKLISRVPGSLIAILAATVAVYWLDLPVDTIGSRFGSVPNTLPAPRLPDFSWDDITRLFSPALSIAFLGAIESLLSAVVADEMIRSRHRSDVELIAQGVANIVSPIFLGIPATGAIARTATNIKNGGKTPVAGIVHAVTLLLIMIAFGDLATLIPMPTLAAVLIVVSYNMSEWRSFLKILRAPRSDVAVMLVTFVLTLLIDLTVSIQVGVILSAMLFIRRMAEVSQIRLVESEEEDRDGPAFGHRIPEGVDVFTVNGSLFFGLVDRFVDTVRTTREQPHVFILETKNLLAIDATGIRAVDDLIGDLDRQGTRLLIAGLHTQPMFALTQSGLVDRIGEHNLCPDLQSALDRAEAILRGEGPSQGGTPPLDPLSTAT